jgi:hypothetical protein
MSGLQEPSEPIGRLTREEQGQFRAIGRTLGFKLTAEA